MEPKICLEFCRQSKRVAWCAFYHLFWLWYVCCRRDSNEYSFDQNYDFQSSKVSNALLACPFAKRIPPMSFQGLPNTHPGHRQHSCPIPSETRNNKYGRLKYAKIMLCFPSVAFPFSCLPLPDFDTVMLYKIYDDTIFIVCCWRWRRRWRSLGSVWYWTSRRMVNLQLHLGYILDTIQSEELEPSASHLSAKSP